MSFISIASTLAIVLGFASTLPHIATMLRARSSNGQSPTGWLIGVGVNVTTGYVNLVGLGAMFLGAGNVIAATFNVIALSCVLRFRGRDGLAAAAGADGGRTAAAGGAGPRPLAGFHELPTGELAAIKLLVDEEHARRAGPGDSAGQQAGPAAGSLQPGPEPAELRPLAA